MNKPRIKTNRGMTYVELIVVLSIFAIMSSIAIFNYGDFQAHVDIKNLTSDIALQVVQAQKSALNGLKPNTASSDWKPAYGVYFDSSEPDQVIFFIDSDGSKNYTGGSEEQDTLLVKKGSIEEINECSDEDCSPPSPLDSVSITFTRPDSSAAIRSSDGNLDHIQIVVKSLSKDARGYIDIYRSGRVQVK